MIVSAEYFYHIFISFVIFQWGHALKLLSQADEWSVSSIKEKLGVLPKVWPAHALLFRVLLGRANQKVIWLSISTIQHNVDAALALW